jgi:hypothetical protein
MDVVEIAAASAKLYQRQVWCRECGSTTHVKHGLRDGWPKCCTFTMTIDPPEMQATPRRAETADALVVGEPPL